MKKYTRIHLLLGLLFFILIAWGIIIFAGLSQFRTIGERQKLFEKDGIIVYQHLLGATGRDMISILQNDVLLYFGESPFPVDSVAISYGDSLVVSLYRLQPLPSDSSYVFLSTDSLIVRNRPLLRNPF